MKRLITTAVATAALTLGGAASAQDLATTLLNVLGIGTSLPYGVDYPTTSEGGGQVYRDHYGRLFQYDQYGRQVFLSAPPSQIVGYDAWGRPLYGVSTPSYSAYAYGGNQWDRDGDGVANHRDRWPNDRRHW